MLLSTVLADGAFAQQSRTENSEKGFLSGRTSYLVEEITVSGLGRTQKDWLLDYLDFSLPRRMSERDAVAIRIKLLTTSVFTSVKTEFRPHPKIMGSYTLHIECDEKWTTIPVIRGAIGGGTPLRVLGMYDINAFGRLLTLGGEMRKYGDAPPGYVAYFRNPRAMRGRYFFGGEVWRSIRRRHFLTEDGKDFGAVTTDAKIARLNFLSPLSTVKDEEGKFPWKAGLDVKYKEEVPAVFDPGEDNDDGSLPEGIAFETPEHEQTHVLPTLQFDNVDIDNVQMDGLKLTAKSGPVFTANKLRSAFESEAFYFKKFGWDLNLALHGKIGSISGQTLNDLYFLGGFDSIRGLPDGAIYGSKAAYTNFELRHLSLKMKYLWIQSVGFVDAGNAAMSWGDALKNQRSSAGVGLRFSIPQVYRLVIRIDYAWSIDGSGTQGFSAGMNQFFQPYRPL